MLVDSEWFKMIPAAKLIMLLQQLPEGALVSCTPVGELAVLVGKPNEADCVGIIEIAAECYTSWFDEAAVKP